MRSIDTYISEAISSHKNTPELKYHISFPKNRMDKDGIIEWLEENEFKRISSLDDSKLIAYSDISGKGTYCVSSYTTNPHTHWMKIYDGEKIFVIRTCKVKDLPGTPMCEVKLKYQSIGKRTDFNDIRKYFDGQEQ